MAIRVVADVEGHCWVAVLSGELAEEAERLGMGNRIPTPFTLKASKATVIEALKLRNPGVSIE